MTAQSAAKELEDIRNDNHSSIESKKDRVDVVGKWVAQQKYSKKIMSLADECHYLFDKLSGGSGKFGIRIE